MKLLDWIIGREPVATATGLAAVVTAGLGVAAVFGLDITAEQIAAIGALAAALAGWAGRRAVTPVTSPADRQVQRLFARQKIGEDTPADDGSIPLALIILIGLAVLLLLGLGVCTDALFHDEDEPDDLGHAPIVLISHERDCDDWNGECGDQYSSGGDYGHNRRDDRNRNRGAFSPGPFDRSPVDLRDNCVSLDCSGRDRENRRRNGDDEGNRVVSRPLGGRGLLSVQPPLRCSHRGDDGRRRDPAGPRSAEARACPQQTPVAQRQAFLSDRRDGQDGSAVDDDPLSAHGRTKAGQDPGSSGGMAGAARIGVLAAELDPLQTGPRVHSREHSVHQDPEGRIDREAVPDLRRPSDPPQRKQAGDPEDALRRGVLSPRSLFPPSFEGVKAFVLSTIKSSIELGRLFADTTITFVENLLFGIA